MSKQLKARQASYPTTTDIKRTLHACQKGGMKIGAVEFSPNGDIRIIEVNSLPSQPANDFEEWDQQGLL